MTGLDPYEAGCGADATTLATGRAEDVEGRPLATVELRASKRCGAFWARAIRSTGANGVLVADVEASGLASSFEHDSDGEVWTDMVPARAGCVSARGGIRGGDGTLREARAVVCAPSSAASVARR